MDKSGSSRSSGMVECVQMKVLELRPSEQAGRQTSRWWNEHSERGISREENRIPLKTDAFGSQTKVYLFCHASCVQRTGKQRASVSSPGQPNRLYPTPHSTRTPPLPTHSSSTTECVLSSYRAAGCLSVYLLHWTTLRRRRQWRVGHRIIRV